MKAKLEFDLPEENNEFYLATHASGMLSVILAIDENLRSKIKYANLSKKQIEILEQVLKDLNEYKEIYDVNLDGI